MSASARNMTELRQEADRFAELLDALYSGIGTPSWQEFIDRLSEAYGGALATLGVRDYSADRTLATCTSDWDAAALRRYQDYYSGIDDWAPRSAQYPLGEVAVSDELVAPALFMRGEFYSDWCRPLGIDLGVCAMLQREGSRAMGVAVLLPRSYLRHDRHAVSRMARLAPHLLRAAQLERQLGNAELRAHSAETALAQLGLASLVCDGAGRVKIRNAAAEALLVSGGGLVLCNGRLDAVLPAEGRDLRTMIAAAARPREPDAGVPGGAMQVSRPGGGVAYEVLVSPAPSFGKGEASTGRVIVFIRDPATRPPARGEMLRKLYGLSGAEARLLEILLEGASLDDVAARCRLSRETLRSQLRGLFRKFDVSSQRELILRCSGSLAGLWRN